MSTVFLDTIGLIALWDNTDQWLDAAQRAYTELRKSRFVGVTTGAVLLECGNASARRPYRLDVNQLRQRLVSTGRLIETAEAEWEQAWEAYDRCEAGDAGIVDHVSFIVMRRLGLRRAFTNDSHFTAAGFETLF